MKKITLTIVSVMLGALIASGAQATVPELIPVQGVLTDDLGEFVDGSTSMTFAVYDAVDATSAIWTETQTVDVDEGFFTAYLGEVTALVVADLVSPSELWLGVTVESDDEMDRVQFAAVPFALEAQRCQQVGNLTESDINTNFLPSSYTPAWSDLTGVPAGFADNTDDGFTTEGDLTALLDDNYAPISHTHAWGDLTGVPSGLSDGDDVGFTTEAELTALLDDNYLAASTPLFNAAVNAAIIKKFTTGDAIIFTHPQGTTVSFNPDDEVVTVNNPVAEWINICWQGYGIGASVAGCTDLWSSSTTFDLGSGTQGGFKLWGGNESETNGVGFTMDVEFYSYGVSGLAMYWNE